MGSEHVTGAGSDRHGGCECGAKREQERHPREYETRETRQQVTRERPSNHRTPVLHGCPSHEQLLATVEQLADQNGADLQLRRVETSEAAESQRFLGSPTVRVNGRDVDPTAAERTDFGLKCRLYRFDGRASPLPPEDWIRAALE